VGLDDVFVNMTIFSSGLAILILLTILFFWKNKKLILPLWFTMGVSAVVAFLLKYSVQRLRPYQIGIASVPEVLEKASHIAWNYSLPSFHTMLVFCTLPFISKEFPKL